MPLWQFFAALFVPMVIAAGVAFTVAWRHPRMVAPLPFYTVFFGVEVALYGVITVVAF